ncbi:MAG: DUF805 domain-containing protein [Bacteroidales bacterium]|jgi:uncharacterized membrane protein YhaH (DUF805 family)|nr:DUF805 domain-containing protein [Bacteroidales bacterium]
MKTYITALRRYCNFRGRATRREFWIFLLCHALVVTAFTAVDVITGFRHESGLGLLSGIYSFITVVPSLAVHVRRLHDIGRSGWWVLLHFTGAGSFTLFLLCCMKSAPHDNKASITN